MAVVPLSPIGLVPSKIPFTFAKAMPAEMALKPYNFLNVKPCERKHRKIKRHCRNQMNGALPKLLLWNGAS
jgi:hypothetical protein